MKRWRARVWALFGLAACGCAGSSPQRGASGESNVVCQLPPREDAAVDGVGRDDAASATTTTAAQPTPPAPSCPAPATSANASEELPMGAPASLIVANEHGVRELNMDGTVRRTLSVMPAARPRWGEGQRSVYFLVPERGQLRVLSLENCAERVVATLPRDVAGGCGGFAANYDPVGAVQSDGDFAVSERAGVACLQLLDRNVNAASAMAVLQVSLADGAVQSAVRLGERCREQSALQPCGGIFGDPPAPPRHAHAPAPAAVHATTPVQTSATLPYRMDGARIVRRGPDGRDHPAGRIAAEDVTEESGSPSGRWVLFYANLDEGDLIYRQLFLLDRQSGGVFPVRDGAWPEALTARQLGNRGFVRTASARVTGETPVRWLPGTDLLVVGTVLFNPGHGSVRLDGDLVM